ncbi:MAG: hypothetical protein K2X38_12910 [Gemmataceae bacterium]|nr:hypothetical protein [Gemmataceae bacterium]
MWIVHQGERYRLCLTRRTSSSCRSESVSPIVPPPWIAIFAGSARFIEDQGHCAGWARRSRPVRFAALDKNAIFSRRTGSRPEFSFPFLTDRTHAERLGGMIARPNGLVLRETEKALGDPSR